MVGYAGESEADRIAREAREAEVQALIARANDPDDPYDGHHGTDRSEDSLAYAIETNPEVARKIMDRLAAAERGESTDG